MRLQVGRGTFPLSRLCDPGDPELAGRAGGRGRVFKTHAVRQLCPCTGSGGFEAHGAKVYLHVARTNPQATPPPVT